jgi:hypothetical protein
MGNVEGIRICCICSATDPLVNAARQLFRDYSDEIQVDLSFQDFTEERVNMVRRLDAYSSCSPRMTLRVA